VAEEVIVHHGASIAVSGLGRADEAFLAALVRGEFGVDADGDTVAQAQLRARLTHAFMKDDPEYFDAAAQTLDIFDLKPEDEATRTMVAGWLDEIYGARTISFGKKGRRPDAEMAWLKFRLYMLARQERPATVRSMYYRMEAAGFIPKSEAAYRLVQRTILDMRRRGIIPWRWVTDSSRRVWGRARFGDMESYAEYVASNYAKDYWLESPVNVEVWCEKDAMQGVIYPVCLDFGLDLYVSKGQSSASYLYEAAEAIKEDGRPTVIYILSDFDPAGFRIAEKIEAGLREHLPEEQELSAVRIAVSYEQVRRYNLTTREVKKNDNGAAEFIRRYGDNACELEAMRPTTVRELLAEHLHKHMSPDRLRILKLAEEEERKGLAQMHDLLGGAA
jgi:hypothetical protein